jgi:glycosyl hydrolase family 44
MIKKVDPQALAQGPSDFTLGGWNRCTTKQNGLYAGQYYPQQLAAYQHTNGVRLLDYFDEHYYGGPTFWASSAERAWTWRTSGPSRSPPIPSPTASASIATMTARAAAMATYGSAPPAPISDNSPSLAHCVPAIAPSLSFVINKTANDLATSVALAHIPQPATHGHGKEFMRIEWLAARRQAQFGSVNSNAMKYLQISRLAGYI